MEEEAASSQVLLIPRPIIGSRLSETEERTAGLIRNRWLDGWDHPARMVGMKQPGWLGFSILYRVEGAGLKPAPHGLGWVRLSRGLCRS